MKTVNGDAFPWMKSLLDQPFISMPSAGLDGAKLYFVIFIDDVYKRSRGPLLNRPLRDEDRMSSNVALDADFDELPRVEIGLPRRRSSLWIGKHKAPLQRARLRAQGDVREVQQPFLRVYASVRKSHHPA